MIPIKDFKVKIRMILIINKIYQNYLLLHIEHHKKYLNQLQDQMIIRFIVEIVIKVNSHLNLK